MNSLIKFHRLATRVPLKKCLQVTSIRQASHYNKDNMPEKKPETEEEHYKAAAKYGMHPDEYESYPDDGWNYRGDYPKLPFVGNATKDPYYPWDNPVYRRNFNEPVHWDADMLGEDRCDVGIYKPYSDEASILGFFLVIGVFGFFFSLSHYYDLKYVNPRLERPMVFNGKKYYEF